MRRVWATLSPVVLLGGGVAGFSAVATAKPQSPPPVLTAITVRASAPSLPFVISGRNFDNITRVLFVTLDNKKAYAMVHHGYAVAKDLRSMEIWTPKIPPAPYKLEVQSTHGVSRPPVVVHVFAQSRFREPWACSPLWKNYSIKGFRGVWIACRQSGTTYHWVGPKQKPKKVDQAPPKPSAPVPAPPTQLVTSPPPPAVVVEQPPPAPPANSVPPVTVVTTPPPPPPTTTVPPTTTTVPPTTTTVPPTTTTTVPPTTTTTVPPTTTTTVPPTTTTVPPTTTTTVPPTTTTVPPTTTTTVPPPTTSTTTTLAP